MHRSVSLAIVIAFALSACGGAPLPPPVVEGVRVWEGTDHTTEGEVLVPLDPVAAYAAVGDLHRWPQIFTDVTSVADQGKAEDTGEEKILLVTTDGKNNNLRFDNDEPRRLIRFRDTGGAAQVSAVLSFEPAPHGHTRVHVRLHADVHGIVSIFVSDAKLRTQRQKKVSLDLANIQRFFTVR